MFKRLKRIVNSFKKEKSVSEKVAESTEEWKAANLKKPWLDYANKHALDPYHHFKKAHDRQEAEKPKELTFAVKSFEITFDNSLEAAATSAIYAVTDQMTLAEIQSIIPPEGIENYKPYSLKVTLSWEGNE